MSKKRKTPEYLWAKLDRDFDKIIALAGWQPNPDTERDLKRLKRFVQRNFMPLRK